MGWLAGDRRMGRGSPESRVTRVNLSNASRDVLASSTVSATFKRDVDLGTIRAGAHSMRGGQAGV